ncbi:ABZJ_00895 family protein [Oceanicola sp. 502str15]|uniref:ABZJ_00895 family protein n=1 Tax=Oceanicola sp. 502str15 TaxID=2696061 RepID=UPI0020957E45|nr:ABZJ_00895 family protein [Oceanicola sp. 502str15]MCO6384977.1 hypothetical protein [Oceanicola sp. 502str15]
MRINLLRYAGVYIAAAVALAALLWALEAFLGVSAPSGLSTALPPMLAALIEGQAYARTTRAPLPGGEAWAGALRMTLVVAAINAVVLLGVLLVMPELREPQLLGIVAVVFVVLLGVVFLANRFFFGMGAKSQLKALGAEGAHK